MSFELRERNEIESESESEYLQRVYGNLMIHKPEFHGFVKPVGGGGMQIKIKGNIVWNDFEEVGGVIVGHRESIGGSKGTVLQQVITDMVHVRNRSRDRRVEYVYPGRLVVLWKVLPYLLRGKEVLGLWHSHPSGSGAASMQDKDIMAERNAVVKKWGKVFGRKELVFGILYKMENEYRMELYY